MRRSYLTKGGYCQSGVDKASIKIKGNSQIISGYVFGQVWNSVFVRFPLSNNPAVTSSDLSIFQNPTLSPASPTSSSTASVAGDKSGLSSDWLSAQSTSKVNICLWNSWSIVSKLNLFQSFLFFCSLPNLSITESWCSLFVLYNEIIAPNFSIFRKDRDCRGGGVFLVVQESIPWRLIPSPASLEIVSVEVLLPHPIVLCLVYILSGASTSYVSSTLQYLSSVVHDHETVLLGDFNFPDINWKNLSSSNLSGNLFCDFVYDHNLLQFNLFIPPLTSKETYLTWSLLSHLILCTMTLFSLMSLFLSWSLTISSSLSLFHVYMLSEHPVTHPSQFIFCKGDYEGLNDFVTLSDFILFYNSNDIEFLLLFLKYLIFEGCDQFIPKSKSSTSRFPIGLLVILLIGSTKSDLFARKPGLLHLFTRLSH